MAQLEHLLEVQGGLIEQYLAQNMGERYAYLLLVAPARPARSVSRISNIRPEHIEAVAFYFGQRVKRLDAEALLDPLAVAPISGGFDDVR